MPPPMIPARIIKRGPLGGAGESVKEMDLTGTTRIVKISIYHSEVIDSLTVDFEHNGIMQCTDRWGGDGGSLTEINLKTDEYIKYVEGYFNDDYNGHEVVMSLKLETNLAVYGPYGTEQGEKFKLQAPTYCQIIGFHAHCGEFVNAVGVYVQINPYIKRDPFGSLGGSAQEMDPTGITRIVKISIYHSEVIDSLAVCFERNGLTQCTDRWGGDGGNLTEINLKTDEYIKSVEGYFNDEYNGHEVVMSLKLETNLAIYGPYGIEEGEKFKLRAPTYCQIIGFHAQYGKFVNAVGVYVQSTRGYIIKKRLFWNDNMKEKEMDPTSITRIVIIRIKYDAKGVRGLAVYSERNGTTECTTQWGNIRWSDKDVYLKTDEYITSVKVYGECGQDGLCYVRSLELKTNFDVYGPYGREIGKSFEFHALGGQIIGFHAYSSKNYLNAFGVYVRQSNGTIIKQEPFLDRGGIGKLMDPTSITRIVKISIYHSDKINGLIVYFERNGTTQCTGLWGRNEGTLSEINLKTNEYIKSVGNRNSSRDKYRPEILKSLVLRTNLDVYGPYGKEEGEYVEHKSLHGQIIGFFASVGMNYLVHVGVYVQIPISKSVPCGGSGGLARDMHQVSAVSRIAVVRIYNGDTINALNVRYTFQDGTQKSMLWGEETGELTEIKFSHFEYIKAVRGYVGYFGGIFIVRSLQLITSRRSYGPYGKEEGTPFELSAFDGQIIGFHGRSGTYLNAIGVYVQWSEEEEED